MLKFTQPEKTEEELLKKLCADSPEGVQAYTLLCINDSIPDGVFFCGRDEENSIRSLVFNDGDEYFRVFGKEFSPLFTFNEKNVLIYDKKTPPENEATEIRGKELLELYRLISQSDSLSFDNEKRYVDRLKAVNKGYAKAFGIYKKGRLISVACVSGINEKYALISDVFTSPSYRNQGLARLLTEKCIGYIHSIKRTPFLRCEKEMCPYYEKLGFRFYGKM